MAHAPPPTGEQIVQGRPPVPRYDCWDSPYATGGDAPGSRLVGAPVNARLFYTAYPDNMPKGFCDVDTFNKNTPITPGHWLCFDNSNYPWQQVKYDPLFYYMKCQACEKYFADKRWDQKDYHNLCAFAPQWNVPFPPGPAPTGDFNWAWIFAGVAVVLFLFIIL